MTPGVDLGLPKRDAVLPLELQRLAGTQARTDNLDQVVISVDDVPLRVGPRPVLAVEIAASQLKEQNNVW